ncbi:MAG: hypothetical protein J5589_10055, partial [Firmicutes bacterium]|nr:hypothetical protein [Bacillota bacterium]
AKVTVEVTKKFSDWDKAESFTFILTAVTNGAPMPAKTTATATKASPLAVFGEIEFNSAGTYEYTITEQDDGVPGVSYDKTAHKVVVTVTKDAATNDLSAVIKYDGADSLTVTNTYTPPKNAKVTVEVTKNFNFWDKADSFTFKLAAVTEGAPMPASTTAKATEEAPLAVFGEIEYEAVGTYEYTITEQDDGISGITYDKTEHKVVVTVTLDAAANTLIATVKYDGADSLTITNTYESPANTGDTNNIAFPFLMMNFSLIMAVILIRKLAKRRRLE